MISLDASVLVRYATADHPVLSPVALRIIKDNQCFLTKAALIELVYVLKSVYRLDKPAIVASIRTILGLETVTVEDYLRTSSAVEWFEDGMDFGDAMILASSADSTNVATFDSGFTKLSRRIGATPPVTDFKN